MQKFFVTGTDTNAGKTYVSVSLLNQFNQLGYSTLGLKPIASGCEYQSGVLVNEDALALKKASSIQLDYDVINPLRFKPAIAPNIAAARERSTLSLQELNQKTSAALAYPADITLIEGAGGWCVPLNEQELFSEYAKHYQFKVILVVGMRLGCINHAILTYRALQQDQVPVAGWIANFPSSEPLNEADEIEATLKFFIAAPFLGRQPHHQAAKFDLSQLI